MFQIVPWKREEKEGLLRVLWGGALLALPLQGTWWSLTWWSEDVMDSQGGQASRAPRGLWI
jgi:hypothetical protein